MNKVALLSFICLVSFISLFAEIKFNPPMLTYAGKAGSGEQFNFVAQSPFGRDTIYTNNGVYDASSGGMISMAGANSADWDLSGNRWSGCGTAVVGITVTDKKEKVIATYTSANGKPFGGIYSIASFADSNWMVIGSDSGVTIAKTDAKGNVLSWTRVLSAPIREVRTARGGNIWAIGKNVYHYVNGSYVTYNDVLPIDGDSYFTPKHGDCDKDGNFLLSYSHANTTGGNMWRVSLAKFDGQIWTSIYSIPVKLNLDTAGFDIIRINKKSNQLWFVTADDPTAGNNFSIGKLDLTSMTLEKMSYFAIRNGDGTYNASPLNWRPTTLTITPDNQVLFGGIGCFVRVDDGSPVVWHPVAKAPIVQKNLSGYIFDPMGRQVTKLNSFSSIKMPAGNYFFRSANNQKAEKISVVK